MDGRVAAKSPPAAGLGAALVWQPPSDLGASAYLARVTAGNRTMSMKVLLQR
jgi:hypothetical protein